MAKESQESCLTPALRKALMKEMGREGGRVTSKAKKKSSRQNIKNFWSRVERGEIRNPITKKFARNGKTKTKA